jgi:tetratricopeptide (TPR) repeat protein
MRPDNHDFLIDSPQLTLYAFQLRHSLSTGVQKVEPNASALWETCAALGKPDKLDFPQLIDLRQQLQCYQCQAPWQQQPCQIDFQPQAEGDPPTGFLELLRQENVLELTSGQPTLPGRVLRGRCYPMRILDSYVLDLTVYSDESFTIEQLRHFNPHGVLLPSQIAATLGQTLQLFVKPLTTPDAELAAKCVDALLADTSVFPPEFINQGKLFGSPIFEFDNRQTASGRVGSMEQCHLLVWFNDHPATLAGVGKSYHTWLHLLIARSKILWTYYQAQQAYYQALELYSQLETVVQQFEQLGGDTAQRLHTLNTLLGQLSKQLFPYVHWIRNIQDHLESLQTNLLNYQARLAELANLCRRDFPEDDIAFLQKFEETALRFKQQLSSYLSYLNTGTSLFDRTLATIRGMATLEQARLEQQRSQVEKSLADNIQALGVGIGAGAIVASSSGLITQAWPASMNFSPFLTAIGFSCAVAGGAWWWVKRRLKKK